MSDKIRILAVDDDPDGLFALQTVLEEAGFDVVTAKDGNETFAKLQSALPDLALIDVMMPGIDGFEVSRRAKADPVLKYIPLVLLTARASLDDIVHGLEQGADDYIKKPFDRTELLARVNALLRVRKLYRELEGQTEYNRSLRAELDKRSPVSGTVARNQKMQEVLELINKVAPSKLPVLVTGESGTGKELIARAVHTASDRKDKPFVVQNCSTFNENLLESELFGHVKGAYTGAQGAKRGLFEVADGGTFFLDELGEMSPNLQAKLLRVLQDGTFIPVGDTRERKVDVRIVAATNKDLKKLISENKFRDDLYYRICGVHVSLPPLRERREDIPALVDHFIKISPHAKTAKTVSPEALNALTAFEWPGNIRQLQNEVERMVVLSGESKVIGVDLLSPEVAGSMNPKVEGALAFDSSGGSLKDAVQAIERRMIEEALIKANGNKSEAARELGISRSNLIAKVQEYGITA